MRIAAGRFKGRKLPRPRSARPVPGRVRTSLFSVLADRLADARVLDLFAGTGAFAFEALSRGAAHVTLVERDRLAARDLRDWIREVEASDQAEVVQRDVRRGRMPAGPFEIVFADPPFELWTGAAGARLVTLAIERLTPAGVLVLKLPKRAAVPTDPAWVVGRRTVVGSVAYALLRPSRGGGGAGP